MMPNFTSVDELPKVPPTPAGTGLNNTTHSTPHLKYTVTSGACRKGEAVSMQGEHRWATYAACQLRLLFATSICRKRLMENYSATIHYAKAFIAQHLRRVPGIKSPAGRCNRGVRLASASHVMFVGWGHMT